LILVTIVFLRRKTAVPPQAWFLKSTLPDIALAWADFFIGKALYDLNQRVDQR